MIRHTTTEVFTPTTVARLTFVERSKPNENLVYALRTPGKQIVVYGRSGSGKTTLLENKLQQTYSMHIKSQCMATTTGDELLLDAFNQLEPFFTRERTRSRKSTKSLGLEGVTSAARVSEIRLQLGRTTETSSDETYSRMLPPQLNATLLAQLLGESDACWVIEDLHKAPDVTRKIVAQMMKLFMDAADRTADVKIIVLGAVGSARDIVQLDKDMWNRVADIEVDLMTHDEIEQIIALGEKALNVCFPASIKQQIAHYANGLAAVCHQICLNMCMNADIHETCGGHYTFSEESFATALKSWLASATESLRHAYDVATRTERSRKYDNCRLIVQALATFNADGATHPQLLARIREAVPEYPQGNLSGYLLELQSPKRGEAILHDAASGKYFFASPMLCAYSRVAALEIEPRQQALPLNRPGDHVFEKLASEVFHMAMDSEGVSSGVSWIDVFTDDIKELPKIVIDDNVTAALQHMTRQEARSEQYVRRFRTKPKPKSKSKN
jgi:hypothetical protein